MHKEWRQFFPMLADPALIYLDSAATKLKPQSVIDTITSFYSKRYGTVHRGVYNLTVKATEEYEGVRDKVRHFINAKEREEILFTRGTTEAINLVAQTYARAFLKEGDAILITEMEHHSNIVPWQLVSQEKKLKLKVLPMTDEGKLRLDLLPQLLEGTKLVALTHLSNVLGTINPLSHIIDLAHKKGALVLVDGAQAASHLPIDVQTLDVDFYAFSGHKIYGPTGIGILYAKRKLLETMPPYQGGGDMVDLVTFEKTTYQPPPLKFEAGTPLIAEVIGLGAALDFIQSIGLESIAKWENHLSQLITNAFPNNILGPKEEHGPVHTFNFEGVHPLDIATLLNLEGICVRSGHMCTQPLFAHFGLQFGLRASLALYNSEEDVAFFLKTLKKVVQKLS